MHNAIGKTIIHIRNASLNQSIYPNRLKFTIVEHTRKVKNCSI